MKERIETLLVNRVGLPPKDQESLDAWYAEAEVRYKKKIPPGFEDSSKDKNESDLHFDGGIQYQKKYGDFVVWKQLLEHVKKIGSKSVIFVTDDGKSDWWLVVDENGKHTIGPRPELIEEARITSGVNAFLMYSPERFLSFAKEFLKAEISDETLKEVRDVSKVTQPPARPDAVQDFANKMFWYGPARSVKQWLLQKFEAVYDSPTYPDLLAVSHAEKLVRGFEVIRASNSSAWGREFLGKVDRAIRELPNTQLHELSLVVVLNDVEDLDRIKALIATLPISEPPSNLRVIFGLLAPGKKLEVIFVPYEDAPLGELLV